MMRAGLVALLGLLGACSERQAADGAIRWDGHRWCFPDGREVTAESLAGGGELLEVAIDDRATVGTSAVWIEGSKSGWRQLRLGGMEPVALVRDFSRDEVGMLLEPSGKQVHLRVNAANATLESFDAGLAEDRFKDAVAKAGRISEPCGIVLPDDSERLTTVAAALRISQSAGPRPVGFVRKPGFSLLVPVKQDPDVSPPGKMDPAKGIPVRVAGDGTIRVGDTILDEEKLSALIGHVAAVAPGTHLRLHGEKGAVFRHSRRIIRLAAAAGVSEIAFVTHDPSGVDVCESCRALPPVVESWLANPEAAVEPERQIEEIRKKSLPAELGPDDLEIFVKLQADGSVHAQGFEQTVEEFGKSLAAIRGRGLSPVVQLYVPSDAKQQAVTDLLNELAKQGINRVNFTDLVE